MPASPDHHPVHPDGRDIQWLGFAGLSREESHDLAPGNNRAVRTERFHGSPERPAMGHFQGAGAVSVGGQGLSADTGGLDNHPRRNARQTGSLENREEIDNDRTGTHPQKYIAYPGARLDRHAKNARHIPGQSATQSGKPCPGHPTVAGEREPTPGRTTGISAALATLERYTRELGTALVAFERLAERQIKRVREQQRNRESRLGR